MFDRFYFDDFGTRYLIVRASEFRGALLPGDEALEHVPHFELPLLLEKLARREPALFRALCEVASGNPAPSMTQNVRAQGPYTYPALGMGDVVRAFGEERSEAPGEAPLFANLYALRPAERGRPVAAKRDSPESQRLDAALTKLRGAPLLLRGESYRLLRAGGEPATFNRASYDTLTERELFSVLAALAEAPSTPEPEREPLRELLAAADTQHTETGSTDLLLLRRQRSYVRPEEQVEPALTPSQLRKAQAPDWLEIVFVSDAGEPMANETYEVRLPDGSTQRGSLDANGMAYLPAVPRGSCVVSFPDFAPRVAS